MTDANTGPDRPFSIQVCFSYAGKTYGNASFVKKRSVGQQCCIHDTAISRYGLLLCISNEWIAEKGTYSLFSPLSFFLSLYRCSVASPFLLSLLLIVNVQALSYRIIRLRPRFFSCEEMTFQYTALPRKKVNKRTFRLLFASRQLDIWFSSPSCLGRLISAPFSS